MVGLCIFVRGVSVKKANEGYTINYLVVTRDGNHISHSISLDTEYEVGVWLKAFASDESVRFTSIIKHVDRVLEKHEIDLL